ncbi:MAG: carboxymuconolactone decarboxylase family protein [Methanocalculus sp. MSAO_Arc2]|uniref:carboxymuconolactone decarboxylase family protein n=1 Tax=Methanocalculus sp. MSAO_Arc2 TaxID=2293855 RepID=UPI000FF6C317|nr:MAG: carboxymuconolactone decarboxylase family protein [Methanocalculus sp. MSAO_Arc2]
MDFEVIIQRIKDEGSGETARCWLEQIEKEYGAVPLIFQKMSEKPEVLISHLLYKGSVTQLSKLEPRVVELISMAVGAALKCSHCVEYHMRAAQAKGATREEILEAVLIAGLLANAAVLADAYRVVNGDECNASCDLSGIPKKE